MWHTWLSHVTWMKKSSHTYESVMPRVRKSYVTLSSHMKLQVNFRKRATSYRALLRKMTCKKWCHTKFSHEWARKCSTRCFFKFESVCFRCNDSSKCETRTNESCHMNEPGCYLQPLSRRQDEWMSHGMHVDASRWMNESWHACGCVTWHTWDCVCHGSVFLATFSKPYGWMNELSPTYGCVTGHMWLSLSRKCFHHSDTYDWVCHVKVGEDP